MHTLLHTNDMNDEIVSNVPCKMKNVSRNLNGQVPDIENERDSLSDERVLGIENGDESLKDELRLEKENGDDSPRDSLSAG